jgi:hypothetical protein
VARILLVGGGCRGRALAAELNADGHALRITTRSQSARAAIEQSGAECWVGTPDRLATLRGALDGVTIACWLLGSAHGSDAQLLELHTRRLGFFLTQMIDTTVRGFVYEARGTSTPAAALAAGEHTVTRLAAHNAIPLAFLRVDPQQEDAWRDAARCVIAALLDRA